MKKDLLQFLALATLSILPLEQAIAEFEKPPILKASKVLDAKLLKSRNYTIDERVENNGYINTYRINSRFGTFIARGNLQLDKRAREIAVLADIEKKYPTTSVTTKAVVEAGTNIVTGPIKAAKKAVDTVSEPEKLKKTVSAIPGGVLNLFSAAATAVSAGTEFAYETGKSALSGGSGEEGETSTLEHLNEAKEFITDKALDYVGYSKAARELMEAYSIDPFTRNEKLQFEIKRVAGIKAAVGTSARFAPHLPSIPGLGTFNKYVKTAEDISAYEDPEKIEKLNSKILASLGLESEEGYQLTNKSFLSNSNYSPIARSAILTDLRALGEIQGRYEFLAAASKAKDPEIAMYYIVVSQKFVEIQEHNGKFSRLVVEAGLPAALGKNDTLYLPIPVDHLVWTQQVAKVLRGFRDRVSRRLELKIKSTEISLSGTLSKKCLEKLTKKDTTRVLRQQGY